MSIELQKSVRAEAIRSIERYVDAELGGELAGERIGNIQAGALLDFFLQEIGPCIYNQAIAHAQERIQMRAAELDVECHEDEFGYWKKRQGKR